MKRRVGAGGFGIVYEVETVLGGLRRALKLLSPQWSTNQSAIHRFIGEALALDRLEHPNVARCFAIGHLGDTGQLCMLLELVEGVSLGQLIAQRGAPLDPKRAVRLALQIGDALRAAHDIFLLHRDLKPENILICQPNTDHEHVKVIDFGLAKLLPRDVTARTTSVAGTPDYMAPEQFQPGATLDTRLDLWQLGAVLHFMLTGRPPYSNQKGIPTNPLFVHQQQQARRGMTGPAPSTVVSTLGLFPDLDSLVSDLLSTEAARRPLSADKVIQRLVGIQRRWSQLHPQSPRQSTAFSSDPDALYRTPSEDNWAHICRELEQMPTGPDPRRVLEPIAGHLSEWPDAMRTAPLRWLQSVLEGDPPHGWSLVRRVDLSHRGVDASFATRLADNAAFKNITVLDLSNNLLGDDGIAALARSEHFQKVHVLNVAFNDISEALRPILEQLGRRHVGYGVFPSHYYAVTSTLLDTIRDFAGDQWTEAIGDAWQDGLDAIARTMMTRPSLANIETS